MQFGCCDIASLSLVCLAQRRSFATLFEALCWHRNCDPRHRRPRALLCLQAELCSQWGSACWAERQGLERQTGSQTCGQQKKEGRQAGGESNMLPAGKKGDEAGRCFLSSSSCSSLQLPRPARSPSPLLLWISLAPLTPKFAEHHLTLRYPNLS